MNVAAGARSAQLFDQLAEGGFTPFDPRGGGGEDQQRPAGAGDRDGGEGQLAVPLGDPDQRRVHRPGPQEGEEVLDVRLVGGRAAGAGGGRRTAASISSGRAGCATRGGDS